MKRQSPSETIRGRVAFDTIAGRYDQLYAADTNPLLAIMRERVYQAIGRHCRPGAALLEVGCGTGEDTLALTARGYRLVATDPAPRMMAEAETKLAAAGESGAVRFIAAGVEELADRWLSLGVEIDDVFSNFAPLNCALSLDPVRALLLQALRPGGRFIAVVLPRLCPMEVLLFSLRGDLKTALRQRQAASALLAAASESYAAALEAYNYGVRSFLDVTAAQRTLAQARSTDVLARTQVLTTLVDLAFGTGSLLR